MTKREATILARHHAQLSNEAWFVHCYKYDGCNFDYNRKACLPVDAIIVETIKPTHEKPEIPNGQLERLEVGQRVVVLNRGLIGNIKTVNEVKDQFGLPFFNYTVLIDTELGSKKERRKDKSVSYEKTVNPYSVSLFGC